VVVVVVLEEIPLACIAVRKECLAIPATFTKSYGDRVTSAVTATHRLGPSGPLRRSLSDLGCSGFRAGVGATSTTTPVTTAGAIEEIPGPPI
jgi:hypothetical protein